LNWVRVWAFSFLSSWRVMIVVKRQGDLRKESIHELKGGKGTLDLKYVALIMYT